MFTQQLEIHRVYLPTELCGSGSITVKFREFHSENPAVYTELTALARQLQMRGHSRYGMKGLFEVLRWKRAMTTTGSVFKLNNNYTALYSRLIMHNNSGLKGFFNIRASSPQVVE